MQTAPAGCICCGGKRTICGSSFSAKSRVLLSIPKRPISIINASINPNPDLTEITEAINAVPFFSEHTLVEIQDLDINKLKDSVSAVLKGNPIRYSRLLHRRDHPAVQAMSLTAVWACSRRSTPMGNVIEFTSQNQGQLIRWIAREIWRIW